MSLYNGNDYYKKMLDLQQRLRKSEEERIRLEEQFALLEQESRSRHETCINRLRMRYINFLEEQQARDERNHQLLGALDRIDSSLALLTAKTERLGAAKTQYEASRLALYENRRSISSVTGDSGVVSQNDERQRRCDKLLRGTGKKFSLANQNVTIGQDNYVKQTRHSPTRVAPVSPYRSPRFAARCESSPASQLPVASSRIPQYGKSLVSNRQDRLSSFLLDNSSENLHAQRPLGLHESTFQPYRHGNTISQRTHPYDSQNDNSLYYRTPEYGMQRNTETFVPNSRSKYGKSIARNLSDEFDNSSTNLFSDSSGHFRHSNFYDRTAETRSLPKRYLSDVLSQTSNLPDKISSIDNEKTLKSAQQRSPQLSEILKQELADKEIYFDNIVGNQLECYINKIRALHRDTDARSPEEIDHEQNTSRDLLNVTLSDDGLDLSTEEKLRERLFPQEFGHGEAQATQLQNQSASGTIDVADNICQHIPIGDRVTLDNMKLDEAKSTKDITEICHPKSKNDGLSSMSNATHQLASINRLGNGNQSREDINRSNYKETQLLAKNGMSADAAKPNVELATERLARNNQVISKLSRNSQEDDEGESEKRPVEFHKEPNETQRSLKKERSNVSSSEEKPYKFVTNSSNLRQHEEPQYKMFNAEENDTDESLHSIVDNLELSNLKALERRVQEIGLNHEPLSDSFTKETDKDSNNMLRGLEKMDNRLSSIKNELEKPQQATGLKIDDTASENHNIGDSKTCVKNGETSSSKKPLINKMAEETMLLNGGELELVKCGQEPSAVGEEWTGEMSPTDTTTTCEETSIQKINKFAENNVVNSSTDHEPKDKENLYTNHENEPHVQDRYSEHVNMQYSRSTEEQYADDASKQVELNDNTEYNQAEGEHNTQYHQAEGEPNTQYHQAEGEHNTQYHQTEGEHNTQYHQAEGEQYEYSRQNYDQTPHEDGYVQDSYEQGYIQDPDPQGSVVESNYEEHGQDPNDQYYADSNEQYTAANQQYPADLTQRYSLELNQQYSTELYQQYPPDPNQQYHSDSDQQYLADPNQEYPADPNQQYSADPNQQYPADANQQYSGDPNPAYPIDPKQQYPSDPNQHYPADPNQEYPADANQQYLANPNQEYPSDHDQQYSADPNQQYAVDSSQQYATDPNQPYDADPNLQYSAVPNQEYSADVDQPYSSNVQQKYTPHPNQEYAVDCNEEYVAVPNQECNQNLNSVQSENPSYPNLSSDNLISDAEAHKNNESSNEEDVGSTDAYESNKKRHPDSSELIVADQLVDNELEHTSSMSEVKPLSEQEATIRKTKNVIESILDTDTESTIEKNVSNTESDFDFN